MISFSMSYREKKQMINRPIRHHLFFLCLRTFDVVRRYNRRVSTTGLFIISKKK